MRENSLSGVATDLPGGRMTQSRDVRNQHQVRGLGDAGHHSGRAAYLLWLYQRVMFGPVTNPARECD